MGSNSIKTPGVFISDLWKDIFYNQKQAWLKIKSNSMAPLIPENSQIFVKCLEDKKIRFGDVVLFTDRNKLIAHRILCTFPARDKFFQSGDHIYSPSFISTDNIIGKVEKVKACEKEIDFKSLSGRLINIIMGISNLGIMFVKKIWPKAGNLLNTLKFRIVSLLISTKVQRYRGAKENI